MHESSIAKNYAEALLHLAKKAGAAEEWGGLMHALAGAIESDLTLRRFLAAPQVSAAQKSALLGKGLEGKAPPMFIRFVQKLITNRRQLLFTHVANAYAGLLDDAAGRVHARVTVSREVNETDLAAIAAQLSKALGKIVVPHATVNPKILGGIVVRVGDTVMDGSVQRRLATLRAKMMGTTTG